MRKTINLAFGLGFLLFFGGCVDKHSNRVVQGKENVEGQVRNGVLSGEIFSLKDVKGKYMVTNNYLGCQTVTREGRVTTVSEPGKETEVVREEGDKITECLTPAAVSLSEVRPQVNFHRGVRPTSSDFVIQTRGIIRASGATKAKNGITVEGDNLRIKHFSYVDFTTNSPFLAPHIDKVSLLGDPATTYKVLHKLTPENLIIMRVSDISGLSHRELSVADNLGNGEFAVPIAFYAIDYLKEDFVRNGDNERTNLKDYFPVADVDDATHISFNVNEDFSELDHSTFFKQDVYPANYFTEGQWYFSESVIDTRPGLEGLIGTTTGAFDFDFRPASKIKFFRTNEMLSGYNIGVDERVDIDSDLKLSPVVEIPAEGISYRLAADGVSEVIENDVDKKKAPYIRMDFQKASTLIKRITDVVFVGGNVVAAGDSEVIDIKFGENSFSFTLQLGATGRRVKYSFLRSDNRPDYQERRHYAGDRNTFGYFVQRKAKIISSDVTHREEDIEKDFFIQRHNPDQTVKFYFSNLTPKYEETRDIGSKDIFGMDIDYRDIGRKAVQYWDAAFKRAGAKGVDLIETVDGKSGGKAFDAPFGDIAYSTINLIESETGSNLLGVGPSLTDPFTGEVINTNANVYIAPFREILARDIRNYIKSQTGYLDNVARNLPASGIVNSSILGDVAGVSSNAQAFIENLLPTRLWNIVANLYHHNYEGIGYDAEAIKAPTSNGFEAINLYTLNKFDPQNSQIQSLVRLGRNIPEIRALEASGQVTFNIRSRSELTFLASQIEQYRPTFYRAFFTTENRKISDYNSLNRDIENKCEKVTELINRLNNKDITELTTDVEAPALQSCMSKLIPEKFMATLVHEMGHNLGLRHNFKGSSDEDNFFTKDEVKDLYGLEMSELDLPKSSSTMDYVRSEQDRLFFPGHYDIAAIRYGYTNAVEVESGVERPNSLEGKYVDISENLELKPDGSIASLVSSEGEDLRHFGFCTDAKASLQIDPMCARHDFGATPDASINDTINSFWESFALWNFRYDRSSAGVRGPLRRRGNFDKAKRMYDEWRFHLADYLGAKDSANSGYLERFSTEEYADLVAKLETDPNFKGGEYLQIRRKVFDFLMDVTFFPNKYCLTNSELGLKALEFEKLRDELKNQVPSGTQVTSCTDSYLQELITEKGLTYISEVGLPVNNMWDYVNPADTFDPNFADENRGLRKPIDTVGTFVDRFFASGSLTARSSGTGYRSLLEDLYPSILDEPDLFLEYEQRVLSRVVDGVDLTDVITRVEGIDFPEETRIIATNFEAESGFLKALWVSLENGIRNPFVNVTDRVSRYGRFFSDDLGQIENAQANGGFVLPLADGSSLIVPQSAEVTLTLAQKLVEINQQISSANTVVPSNEEVLGGLGEVVSALSSLLIPAEGAESITAEQYLIFNANFFGALNQIDPFQAEVLFRLFFDETIMYQAALQGANDAITQAQAEGVEPPADAIEYITNTLADWNLRGLDVVALEIQAAVADQLPPGAQVVVPTAQSMSVKLVQNGLEVANTTLEPIRANAAQAIAQFELNEEDIFAQFDLIRSILTFDLQESQQQFINQISELFSDNGEDYVSHYNKLVKSTRLDVRFYAEKYLNPADVLKSQGIVNRDFKTISSINRF